MSGSRASQAYCLLRGGGGCEIRTREGLPPTRFPSLWACVRLRLPTSAASNSVVGRWPLDGAETRANETRTETGQSAARGDAARRGHQRVDIPVSAYPGHVSEMPISQATGHLDEVADESAATGEVIY